MRHETVHQDVQSAAIHSSAALTAEDSLSEDGDVADEEEFECVICRQKLNAAEVVDHVEAHNIQHQENEPCTTTASSQTCSDNLPNDLEIEPQLFQIKTIFMLTSLMH